MKEDGFSTRSIHAGEDPEEVESGDVIAPINLTTTFAKEDLDEIDKGYVYSRTSNPTRDKLEKKIASLESGKYGLAFASGMATEQSVLMSLLEQGDHVLAFDDLYGGTKRLFDEVMVKFGLHFDYVDATDLENIIENVKEDTELIWLESPTNPLMKLSDIEEISKIADQMEIDVVVDNTFATPYFQRPLELGADIVVHSLTKYIGGHSDVVGGAVVTNDEESFEKMKFNQNAAGAILSPFNSWLVMRGIKTLKPRMELHEKNAKDIADHLEGHRKVKKVHYPGLESHPQHELAKKQMDGFGGMLSFEIDGGSEEAKKFIENLEIFHLAESLGGVESLAEIPSVMTHASVPKEKREKVGIKDSLIRLSVGIEESDDLVEDLESAFRDI